MDGGWWPRSRDATRELPELISALDARIGGVVRLSVDAGDWTDIPRRLTVGGRLVRVGHFPHLDNKIILTRAAQDHVMLLVVPPDAAADAAEAALAMAADGDNRDQPGKILVAAGVEPEVR